MGWTTATFTKSAPKTCVSAFPIPIGPTDRSTPVRRTHRVLEAAGTKTLRYLYDFGDGWEHTIKIERVADPEPDVAYPRLIKPAGRCPPEDVGGPWGYADLIEALDDPDHERHAEMREWVGEGYDPRKFDAEFLKSDVAALAKRWSKKPASKAARRA